MQAKDERAAGRMKRGNLQRAEEMCKEKAATETPLWVVCARASVEHPPTETQRVCSTSFFFFFRNVFYVRVALLLVHFSIVGLNVFTVRATCPLSIDRPGFRSNCPLSAPLALLILTSRPVKNSFFQEALQPLCGGIGRSKPPKLWARTWSCVRMHGRTSRGVRSSSSSW